MNCPADSFQCIRSRVLMCAGALAHRGQKHIRCSGGSVIQSPPHNRRRDTVPNAGSAHRTSCTSFNSLPFFQLRRPGELVDRRSPPPVLVPGLALVFERRVRHVAGPLLNSHRCGPSAPPWAPIYRCPHSLATSEAFAVQERRMGFHLVDPPLSALAALPESLLHDRP